MELVQEYLIGHAYFCLFSLLTLFFGLIGWVAHLERRRRRARLEAMLVARNLDRILFAALLDITTAHPLKEKQTQLELVKDE